MKSITYVLELTAGEVGNGPIRGAQVVYPGRDYLPPEDKPIRIDLRGLGATHLATVEESWYNPAEDTGHVILGSNSYRMQGSILDEASYRVFYADMICLAKNHRWKLLGNKIQVPEHLRPLFEEEN